MIECIASQHWTFNNIPSNYLYPLPYNQSKIFINKTLYLTHTCPIKWHCYDSTDCEVYQGSECQRQSVYSVRSAQPQGLGWPGGSWFSGLLQPDKGLPPPGSALNSNITSLKRFSSSTPNSCCPPRRHCPSRHPESSPSHPSHSLMSSFSFFNVCLPPEHKLHEDSGCPSKLTGVTVESTLYWVGLIPYDQLNPPAFLDILAQMSLKEQDFRVMKNGLIPYQVIRHESRLRRTIENASITLGLRKLFQQQL